MPIAKQKFLILLSLFIIPFLANGAVVVSEIAWMGSDNGGESRQNANDEWIELQNNGNEMVDLNGWSLISEDGKPSINLSGSISGNGFFLLERTNDESAPDVSADIIYTGALGNSGEILILKNGNGIEIQKINAKDGWPAGDNSTKQTMQWSGSSWVTAKPTPKAQNFGVQNAQAQNSGAQNTQQEEQISEPIPLPEPIKPAEETEQIQQEQTVVAPESQSVASPAEPAVAEPAVIKATKVASDPVTIKKDEVAKQQEIPFKQIAPETTAINQKQADELDELKQTIIQLQQKIQKIESTSPPQQQEQKEPPIAKSTVAVQAQTASAITAVAQNLPQQTRSIGKWLLMILGIGIFAGAGSVFIRHQGLV